MKEKSGVLKLAAVLAMVVFIGVGCTATLGQKRAVMGLADWWVVNHELLGAEYTAAPAEHQVWLWENVVVYFNLMKYGIIGLDAVGEDNAENMAFAVNGIMKWAHLEFDVTNLVNAIKAKDYDTIQIEVLMLKNFIIAKWLESQETEKG